MLATRYVYETTRRRLRRACASLDLAEVTGSPYSMSRALTEVARSHLELGALATAEAHFESALRWARLCGSPDHVADLLCESADVAVRVAAAQEPATASMPGSGTRPADFTSEPSRNRASHAARERARDRAFEVSQLAGRISDPTCEARLLLRVSELLERCGDHADAMQMQLRALNRLGGVAPRDPSLLSGFGRLADS